jgi:hypothetical protein
MIIKMYDLCVEKYDQKNIIIDFRKFVVGYKPNTSIKTIEIIGIIRWFNKKTNLKKE